MKPDRPNNRWGHLVALVVIGALAWQHAELVARQLGLARELLPVLRTRMEMTTYRQRLSEELPASGLRESPAGLRTWLDSSFRGSAKEPGVDYFGTPYRLEIAGESRRIRSCGPDRRCDTNDDLVASF
jgi:hypothetical protein